MESLFLSVERPGLFRSSPWILAWVKAWADHADINFFDKPSILAADTAILRSLDLPSFIFIANEPLLGVFSIVSAYPFGVSSKRAASIRSEYFQFSVDLGKHPAACINYIDNALAVKWDRFTFPDVLLNSPEHQSIIAAARLQKLSLIKGGHETTYGVNVKSAGFADYLNHLGKNSRLKLFNSRTKLQRRGEVKVENIWPDRPRFFSLLNAFHLPRWGKPCYGERNEVFINALLDELPAIGGKVDFSVMTVDGEVVSVVFDIEVGRRIYNLQAGYREDFVKGVALGTLHLGYQIEAAFANKDADYYDFMAGRGKNSNYKKSLANSSAEFITLTLVRNRLLGFAYKVKACVRNAPLPMLALGIFCC